MSFRKLIFALAVAGFLSLTASPGHGAVKLSLTRVVKVDSPTMVTSAPGQPRLVYVVQRKGQIRIIRGGKLLKTEFLDISRRVKTSWIEQGLLGLAFPPNYAKSGRFYVHYVTTAGDVMIEEYRRSARDPRVANPASRRVVLRIPKITDTGNHNGGAMRFLGKELYIAVGDGNNPGDAHNQAQDLNSLRGKILRIDPRPDETVGRTYRVPVSNPLVGKPGRDEIFAWGFRNPHAFSFHQPPGGELHMLIADVGQERYEEINYVPYMTALGGNFGWKLYEGVSPYDCGEACPNGAAVEAPPSDLIWPSLVYSHSAGCAVIGGAVISDPSLASIKGRIIYGDFCTNRLRTAAPASWITDDRPLGTFMPPGKGKHPALNGIGTDHWGRVYLFSNFGPVYRLEEVRASKAKKAKPKKKKNKKKSKKPTRKGGGHG